MESFGIVLIEAMSRGRPVFAVPQGGIPEIFDDGVEGRYLSFGDVEGNVSRLLGVLGNPDTELSMGRAARRRFLRDFEENVVANRLVSFLHEVEANRVS
jgi:glycosyltransferase involved in cell wall biosynthesis